MTPRGRFQKTGLDLEVCFVRIALSLVLFFTRFASPTTSRSPSLLFWFNIFSRNNSQFCILRPVTILQAGR
ncbi:hypothetical protein PoB_006429300 [Plakobranchus ocellatus]|uniref:Secreted protein n=1 Tax=Plakobranchus ocellatus TaxID=259542 RepID=A0AAV4D0Y1_9GAST|nr:hypothetical protein PoB_006429300 [Plakobranchus ocellatus]